MTRVKICGVMELDVALAALDAGADLLGFVFAESRRRLSEETASEIVERCREAFPPAERPWRAIGVFANQPLDTVLRAAERCSLDGVQLSGQESPEHCRALGLPLFKAVHVPDSAPAGVPTSRPEPTLAEQLAQLARDCGAERILLDSGGAGRWGGTGGIFCWERVGVNARECLVAGGLTPDNVSSAIAQLQPWGVDVSSGVESGGRKDIRLIRAFVQQVRMGDRNGNDR